MAAVRDGSTGRPAPLFTQVNVGRISELIVDQIRLLIRSGELRAGDRLPAERELCTQFGVSRVTVREALRVLEANGLVEVRVGARGGAFVTTPSSDRVGEGLADLLRLSSITAAEVTEARLVFELGLVPLICERRDDADLDALLEICDRSEATLAAGHYEVSLSAEFHVRAASATHNAAIEMLVRSFRGPMLASLEQAQKEAPTMGAVGAAEHRGFVDAVRERDVAAATDVMSGHLHRTADRLNAAHRSAKDKESATRGNPAAG